MREDSYDQSVLAGAFRMSFDYPEGLPARGRQVGIVLARTVDGP